MQILDGFELTHMIRQPVAKSNPYVGVIMLTGHSEKKCMTDARDAGVTEFIVKPISAKGLYQRIINVVANSRPLIQTKTYFGTDRRRNVNTNYVGPGLRKGGKADVIRQTPALEKIRSPSEERNATHGSVQRHHSNRNLRRSRGDNAGEQAAQCGFLATTSPGRRGSDLARGMCSIPGSIPNVKDRRKIGKNGFTTTNKRTLFHAAHDINGEAVTFGFPAVGAATDSPCRLIEHTTDVTRIPISLVD
jgi:hypothetical protein